LYYLQSRYYNPEWGRFINADGIIGQAGELLSHNLFAYCSNNPVIFKDQQGYMREMAFDGSGGGGGGVLIAAAVTGGLDDVVKGLWYATVGTIGVIGNAIISSSSSKSTSQTRAKSKAETTTANPPNNEDTIIYRYGGTNPGNFVSTPRDVATNTGLSFSTIPRPGAAMTTIGTLNATGIVTAVQDSPTHVSVRPVGATIKDWRDAGSSSIWTAAIKSKVIKWDGGN
jgi:hypothetical protein